MRGIPLLAASAELRSLARGATRFAHDQVHVIGGCHVVLGVSFSALAATGRRCRTRPAAKPVRWGRREAWRLEISNAFEQDCLHSRPRWLQAGPGGLLSKKLGGRPERRGLDPIQNTVRSADVGINRINGTRIVGTSRSNLGGLPMNPAARQGTGDLFTARMSSCK